ncbi:MAG: hypothetical protein GEV28_29855 [Actinophytocola sp.]|uniref:CGNR zinc finger domain-containing protein n=1 Tax=Actinophytocola sp. TaxID=1872138 RepID=UPI001325188E|nr:CGNR zinc finger domain-containing protein [Actinophytocola sp.]MPZ84371.1 hypothetical protein [Actinophytocola sp.]
MTDTAEEQTLLDLLNSTPVVDGTPRDELADDVAREWTRTRGGTGSPVEVARVLAARDRLQAVVRGDEPASVLELHGARLVPELASTGVSWHLDVDDDHRLAARLVLTWARLREDMPGRLRPCANDECRLFLLDRSRANTARWCSMKVCGNRLKARRHYQRIQTS